MFSYFCVLSKKRQEEEKGELDWKTRIRPASGASGCLFHWEIVNQKEKKQKQGHIKCVYTINRQKECQHKRTQTSREEKRTKGYKKANRPQNLKQMATPKEMAQGNFVDSMPFHGDRTHQNLPTTRSHDAHTLISMAYRLKKKICFSCFVFHHRNLIAISYVNAPKVRRYIYCNLWLPKCNSKPPTKNV